MYGYKSIEKTQSCSSKRRRPSDSATLYERRRTKYSTYSEKKNKFWFHNNIQSCKAHRVSDEKCLIKTLKRVILKFDKLIVSSSSKNKDIVRVHHTINVIVIIHFCQC